MYCNKCSICSNIITTDIIYGIYKNPYYIIDYTLEYKENGTRGNGTSSIPDITKLLLNYQIILNMQEYIKNIKNIMF
jgi:hypothetical protein